MKLGVFEIFAAAAKEKSAVKKANVLKDNEHPVLWQILKYTFDDKVEFLLPGGSPPFNAIDLTGGNAETLLYKKGRILELFRKKGQKDNLTPLKREMKFIELLEQIHPSDSQIIIDMINKKAPKGITKNVVDKAFPGLLAQRVS